MLTYEQNVKAVLECIFAGYKDELIEDACRRICALSSSEIPNTCGDAISRQAVDDAIYDYSRSCNVDYSQIMEYIEKLPSVTPQHSDAEIQKIQEMEQAEIQKAYELGKAEMQSSDDAISRDKVIVQLSHLLSDWDDDWNVGIRKCIETVKSVESVTPQQKMGHWIEHNKPYDIDGTYYCYCDNCGGDAHEKTDFCPNCGCKMEVEE